MIDLIIIILSTQMLFAYDSAGQQVFQVPVAVGQPKYSTPVSETYIEQVVIYPWWHPTFGSKQGVPPRHKDNAMGVAKVMMKGMGNIRIHSADQIATSMNGPRYMSSGCIRLTHHDMIELVHRIQGEVDWSKTDQWVTPDRRIRVSIRN
jgi:murein L,D-transpeptidase YcbB/YkuD